MQKSGTRLVIAISGLALVLGSVSWWYRYEAAHRATQFWGGEQSRLIAESEGLEAITLEPGSASVLVELGRRLSQQGPSEADLPGQSVDLGAARGQAHLRHAILSDRNYVWAAPVDAGTTEWRWCLRFFDRETQVAVLLSRDLTVVGKYEPATESIRALSCKPMTASLAEYFQALGL